MSFRFLKSPIVPVLLFSLINYCSNIPSKPPQPSIRVISPDADSVWVAGATYTLRWNFSETSGDSVKISLCNDTGVAAVIRASAANSGACSWKIPPHTSGNSRYYITVCNTVNDTISGRSGIFTIVNYSDAYEPDEPAAMATPIDTGGPAQYHTLPYHDTDWFKFDAAAGRTYCIQTHGNTDTYIRLYGTDTVSLIASDDNSGVGGNALVLWTCGLNGTCFFKITGTTANASSSSPYTVDVRAGSGILAIVNPYAGQSFGGGDAIGIVWRRSANSGNDVSLFVYRGDTLVDTVDTAVANNGHDYWVVPYTLATSPDYRIKIVNDNDTTINNFSEPFAIANIPTTITIATPSSATQWNTGSTYTIYWAWSGYPGTYVQLTLYDSAGTSSISNIAGSAFTANGQCPWTIPVTLATGPYRIKIACTAGPAITAFSDAFTITNIPQSISIAAPGAQDTWNAGATRTIIWSSTGPIGNSVTIGLYSDTDYVVNISSAVAVNSNCSWALPVTLAGGNRYRIKIVSNDFPSVFCFSNYFTITPVPDSLVILQPTAASSWNTSSSRTISWRYSGSPGPSVKLDLYDSAAFLQTIAASAPIAGGAYSWLLPSTLHTDSRYRIRIASVAKSTLCDTSDFFTVTNMSGSITVTAPLSSDTWTAGSSHFISWYSSGVVPGSFVVLYLYDSTARAAAIGSGISRSADDYVWTVPATFKGGGKYRLQVVCTSDTSIYGYSGTFTIAAQPDRLTITKPSDTSTWTAGEYYTIYWSYSGPDIPGTYVRLDLYDSSSAIGTIASNVYTTNSSFLWLAPSSLLPGNRYRIRISSAVLDTVFALSDSFTITNPALVKDAYEPDDSYTQATAIAQGDAPQSHTLSSDSDQDWYKFNAVSGTTYTIETHGSLDTYLDLFSTDGESLLDSDDDSGVFPNARITWICTVSGTYYFRVTSSVGDIGSYTITVR